MKLAVVGLGLIGGSLEKAAKRSGHEVAALHHGDAEGLAGAEVVFVCLPPDATAPWIAANAGLFSPGAVVVDVCGVKREVMDAVSGVERKGWTFVGGHPMAGKEKGGYANSEAGLFDGASMILTPFPGTPSATLAKLEALFAELGFARTVVTTPERHDAMIAYTSQLCHVIATAYSREPKRAEADGFTAGSFANMTRTASQDEETWSSLYLSNRDSLLGILDGFISRLSEFRDALALSDAGKIKGIIREGASRP